MDGLGSEAKRERESNAKKGPKGAGSGTRGQGPGKGNHGEGGVWDRTEVGQGVPGAWPRPSMAVVRSHMARLPLAWPVSR